MEENTKNYTDVYTRNVIVALCVYLKNSIWVTQIVENKEEIKKIPFYYSMTGNDQFLIDNFIDSTLFNDDIPSNHLSGNTNTIPSGRVMLRSVSISGEDISGGYNRIKYQKYFETDFSKEIRNMSAFAYFLPMMFNFDISIKTSKEIERMKLFDSVLKWLNKIKKFYINYSGVEKIPCVVTFPDDYSMEKTFQFGIPSDDKRPLLDFSIGLKSFFPMIDYSTERDNNERIKVIKDNISTK